jgi:hypothetical protein
MIGEVGNFKMKKLLLILLCLPMIGFGQNCLMPAGKIRFASKNPKSTIPKSEMLQLSLADNSQMDFVGQVLTLNNFKEGALNFHTRNDSLFCNAPKSLMLMSMPPKPGIAPNMINSNTEFFVKPMSLLKLESVNIMFVGHEFHNISFCIKQLVTEKINQWQQKGEFEKISEYKERVNEQNRKIKIKEYQEIVLQELKDEFLKSIDFSNIELGIYDSENETFLLKDKMLGDLVLSVPINEAQEFKKSFASVKFLNAECVIIDDRFVLSYVKLKVGKNMKNVISFYNGKEITTRTAIPPVEYTYNLSNAQDYSLTEIDYNFSAIELDDIKSSKKAKSSRISTNKIQVGTSTVNINIPTNKKVKNRYALVIGNEDYSSFQRTLSSEQNVDYAVNDASTFKKYCLNTLGVKEDNMFFLLDATTGQMSQEIDLISKILSKLGDEAELIVYYAGHGFPDELTKIPYLIPVDVSATNLSSAIKLSEIYTKLSSTGASKVTVFLDACFTGGGRESGLMASRGVKIKPKEGSLSGNLVVFSASSGNQSALPYHDEGHGMFTYYLLKKLQESKGKVTMGELADYITNEVSIQSLKINEKEQDPKVNTSSKVINDWINWKF